MVFYFGNGLNFKLNIEFLFLLQLIAIRVESYISNRLFGGSELVGLAG